MLATEYMGGKKKTPRSRPCTPTASVASDPGSGLRNRYKSEISVKNNKRLSNYAGYRLWCRSVKILLQFKKLWNLLESSEHTQNEE